jgi:hypothetical protein
MSMDTMAIVLSFLLAAAGYFVQAYTAVGGALCG